MNLLYNLADKPIENFGEESFPAEDYQMIHPLYLYIFFGQTLRDWSTRAFVPSATHSLRDRGTE